jgi:NADPH2:quinone reductase
VKAVYLREFGPPGTAAVEDIELPVPGPTEVLIDVKAVAANYVDILVLEGRYQFSPPRPFVPGKGPAGIVRQLGADVAGLSPGDRVLAMCEQGGYAQMACADQAQCYRLPPSMPFEDAASMSLAFDTAWMALIERGRLRAGETVLVLGAAGAVGNAAVQLAKAKGATVLGAVSSLAKAAMVTEAGADHVVDLAAPNLRDALRQKVHAANDGRGADVVIDTLGGDFFDAAIRALDWRGRIVVVGFASGRIADLKTNYLLLKNIEASGLQISDYRKRTPDLMRECFADLFRLYEQGGIRPAPFRPHPLQDYANALNALKERTATGRAILLP